MPKALRHEHPRDEGVPGPVPGGALTIPQRKVLAGEKAAGLAESIRELEDSVAYIDWKQNFYDEVLAGKRPYVSNLIPRPSGRKNCKIFCPLLTGSRYRRI